MMTRQNAALNLAPTQLEELYPPREVIDPRLIELDNGCQIWTGTYSASAGPIVKWHGRQFMVARVLWFHQYGIVPAFALMRLCEPSACVAPLHRAPAAYA
jgi:hypothetical protein